VVARQSLHLARIVDDLLEVSRVTAGRIQLSLEAVDVNQVVNHVVESLRASGRLDPYEVVVAGERAIVEADLARIDQVITNLLVNAVKYTDPGGRITVRVSIEGDQAVVRVTDNGIGISPELLPNLFEVFVQGRQALDRADGGLGIGLALVKKLIELQSGSVEATSAGPGRGSTFVVRMPRLTTETPKPANPGAEPEPGTEARSPLRVLVVDDNTDVRGMLRTLLELGGHRIDEAISGPQAVQQAVENQPQLALVDLGIPGFDGFEVARRLRDDPRTRSTMLVAVTGYGQSEDRRKSSEAGFDAHLVKPVTSERLDEVLALAARRSGPNGSHHPPAADRAAGP
jgi:CheY-like chemotaxis protein/two-component sensor histidine kinase